MTTREMAQQIAASLDDRAYAEAFVKAEINTGIPFQIRALRQERGWTQTDLAKHTGQHQKTISDFENPDIGPGSIASLLKIAAAFDVGLIVRFTPYSELVEWSANMTRASHFVPSRTKDTKLMLQRNGTRGNPTRQDSTFVQIGFGWKNTRDDVVVEFSDWLTAKPSTLSTSKDTLHRAEDLKREQAS